MVLHGKIQAASLVQWPYALTHLAELHWIHPQAAGVP